MIIQEISFLKEEKQAGSPVLVVYDHKLAGESVTNPRQRVPPLKDVHLQKCLGAYLEIRHGGGENSLTHLHPAYEFVLYDGGQAWSRSDLAEAFREAQEGGQDGDHDVLKRRYAMPSGKDAYGVHQPNRDATSDHR